MTTVHRIDLHGQVIPVDFPTRSRRRTDVPRHVENIRPLHPTGEIIVVQRAGGPLYDHQFDAEWRIDDCPPHGIERSDAVDARCI